MCLKKVCLKGIRRKIIHKNLEILAIEKILINYVYQKCVEGDVLWEETVIIITECINSLWSFSKRSSGMPLLPSWFTLCFLSPIVGIGRFECCK